MNIYKLNVLYQISLSQDSKSNFVLIGMSFNHEKCPSEMHQFESADPVGIILLFTAKGSFHSKGEKCLGDI